MPRDLSELAEGQHWAYRHRQTDEPIQVEVLRLGSGTPPRVQVRFVNDEFEGRQEWVPPGRLKVPWAEVTAWHANQQRWANLRQASELPRDSPEGYALSTIFDSLPSWNLTTCLYNQNTGIILIHDVDALATELDLSRDLLTSDPTSFLDEAGNLVVPWSITRVVVQAVARKHADVLLSLVAAEEQEAQQHNRWGYMSRGMYIDAEICADTDRKFALVRELIRQWCGAEARERHDELAALRVEVVRLGKLIERTITALRAADRSVEADAFERELGIPVDVLRQAKMTGQGP